MYFIILATNFVQIIEFKIVEKHYTPLRNDFDFILDENYKYTRLSDIRHVFHCFTGTSELASSKDQ